MNMSGKTQAIRINKEKYYADAHYFMPSVYPVRGRRIGLCHRRRSPEILI